MCVMCDSYTQTVSHVSVRYMTHHNVRYWLDNVVVMDVAVMMPTHFKTLQHAVIHGDTLKHTVTHCNTRTCWIMLQ